MQPWYTMGRKRIEPVPFEVTCACGQLTSGFRQPSHQVIACPGCGSQVFILPRSPLPAPRPFEGRESKIEDRGRSNRILALLQGPWRYPLLAGAFALAIMAFTVIFQLSKKQNSGLTDDPKSVTEYVAAGKKLLGQGR